MWILDTSSNVGKMSPIQMAILMEYAKAGENNPLKITDVMAILERSFENFWLPKKGTIYPAVHNLHMRGFLKMHAIKPYGYSITPQGTGAILQIISNINKQMQIYMHYYSYLLDSFAEINSEKAFTIKRALLDSFEEFLKDQKLTLKKKGL